MSQDEFNHAIQIWHSDPGNTCKQVLKQRFLSGWVSGNATVLQYPRELALTGNRLPDDSLEKIREALETASYPAKKMLEFFIPDTTEVEQQQVVDLVKGMLNGILAAHHLSSWDKDNNAELPAEAASALRKCLEHYHAAWDLESVFVENIVLHAATAASDDKATAALDRLHSSVGAETDWWRHSNWLLVRRLISYLLGDSDHPQVGTTNKIHMLLVSGPDSESQYQGATAPVTTTATKEGYSSAYLDPISLGVMIFDDDMLKSLRIASEACRSELRENQQSLRIAPDLRQLPGTFSLQGASAGGIITLATCATALGTRLDRTVTASFVIVVDEEILNDTTRELNIDDIKYGPVKAESIAAKLQREKLDTAIIETGDKLKTVYLHHEQTCCLNGDVAVPWDEWVNVVANQQSIEIEPVGENTTLRTLIHEMSGDERMEKVLAGYAENVCDAWDQMTSGTVPDAGDDHKLDIYIEPRLSVQLKPEEIRKLRAKQDDANSEDNATGNVNDFHELENGVNDLVEQYVLQERSWLLITEIAGGGKTVLSWRIWKELSALEKPYLVVRYENNWPKDKKLCASLVESVKPFCGTNSPSPDDVVTYLLKQKRVVVILDALDQINPEVAESLTSLHSGNHQGDLSFENLQMIVTSRPHAVNQWPDRFNKDIWRHFHLELFNDDQIEEYKNKLIKLRKGEQVEEYWKTITEKQKDNDLLQLPNNLKLIRAIIEESLATGEAVRPFVTTGDLRWEMAYRGFHRDTSKGQNAEPRKPEDVEELIRAASCLGFEILHRATQTQPEENAKEYNLYHLPGDKIVEAKEAAKKRYGRTDDQWEKYDKMLMESIFTGSTTLKKNDNDELSFPSLKTMEFFVGLYLSRYASDKDIEDIKTHIGDERWKEAWVFAIEMFDTTNSQGEARYNWEAYSCTVPLLFNAPSGRYLRPTELMFRVWQILKRNKADSKIEICLDEVLKSYRGRFRQILLERDEQGNPAGRALRAAELVHENDLHDLVFKASEDREEELRNQLNLNEGQSRVERQQKNEIEKKLEWLKKFDDESIVQKWVEQITPRHNSYSFCADSVKETNGSKAHLTFMMGSSSDDVHPDADETPWQMVRVNAFHMATCCVTRAQYQLFDPHLEKVHKSIFDDVYEEEEEEETKLKSKGRSPEPDCPVITTNWFDGFCLGLWLGDQYRLPSEFEWEGAAWGGIDRWETENRKLKYSVPYEGSISVEEINFDQELNQTLPVRWDQDRYNDFPAGDIKEKTNGPYDANGFGLYHVNGNVWEWNSTVWDPELLKRRIVEVYQLKLESLEAEMNSKQAWLGLLSEIGAVPGRETQKEHASSYRSLRGGSWYLYARNSRTSVRLFNWYDPVNRYNFTGLRILRTQ